MNAAVVALVLDAVIDSRPVRLALAAASMAVVVGFLGVMAAAVAIDVACGREGEWPT